MQYFRGNEYDISEEFDEILEKHICKTNKMKSTSWAFTCKRIFSMGFFRPFLCAGLLGILSIMSGFNVVTNYMIIILEESYSSIDPNIGPIIVGSLGLLVACK